MILILEAIIGSLVFGLVIVISVLKNKEFWLYEYPEEIQKVYIESNPNVKAKEVERFSIKVLIKKSLACILFILILTTMVKYAGADTFIKGLEYTYFIWFIVNAFDTLFIDCILLVHAKAFRLPGTIHMDKEYKKLTKKSLIDGIYGCIIGIPVSLIVGLIISFI